MIDRFGTPFSAALHVIERYTLIDGKLAQDLQQKHVHNYFPHGSPFRNILLARREWENTR
jgi:hypothetical protein